MLNTAYIERLNAIFRARLAALVQRTLGLMQRRTQLQTGMYPVSTVYNFCTYHASLSLKDRTRRTPTMAAGIIDHCWGVVGVAAIPHPASALAPPNVRADGPKPSNNWSSNG
jgi:predicted RecB family nuclease